jgi:hypothetical protein
MFVVHGSPMRVVPPDASPPDDTLQIDSPTPMTG